MEKRIVARTLGGLALALGALAAGCGSDEETGAPPGYYIVIAGMAFAPLELAAPPGATLTVQNADAELHSVTSQASPGAFTPGAVAGVSFDTGEFSGTTTFTLPADAPEGTVVPYYCRTHTSAMATPNGTIRVQAAAAPAPPPGGYRSDY